ncbi:hypothetical protein ABK040_004502 [Willaertia magna]
MSEKKKDFKESSTHNTPNGNNNTEQLIITEDNDNNNNAEQQIILIEEQEEEQKEDLLQNKIKHFLEKAKSVSLLENLKSQHNFHNPEILNKIMKEYTLENQYGTNFSKEIFPPIDIKEYVNKCKKRQEEQERQNFIQMQKQRYQKY